MTLQPFSDEQLNFLKFSSIVLNEFPKVLRQTFKTMWDNTFGGRPGFQLWDDSIAVRNLFATTERGKTKVPIHQSYNEWDCTNLFQATIFAWSFASLASTGSFTKLNDLYVKPRGLPHGSFHACVLSPGGNNVETFALAIDQLRLLRNSLCHSTSSEMDKLTFDQRVSCTKDAFKALGVSTAQIDAVGSLTESDFPTNEVRRLEMRLRDETRAYIKFLEEVSSDISEIKALLHTIKEVKKEDTENIAAGAQVEYATILEGASSDINVLKQMCVEDTASREVIARLEGRINELKSGHDERDARAGNSDMRSSLLGVSLPSVVPNFTGRQGECEEIIRHVSSESTQLVSIWGTPGFGKTSVAIAVGHALQSQGKPVYWVSLRGVRSKTDLASKFLSFLRQPTTIKQPSSQRLSTDEEVCQLFSDVSKPSAFILDNLDDFLESGSPKAKEEVMQLLEEILRRNQRLTFVVTTRESLDYMDLHFQGHKGLRIRPLDKASAKTLVSDLLPNASTADCTQIAQICGQVPLAMKLMCSLISEDSAQPRQIIDDLIMSSTENRIIEMLNNPDYPPRHRIHFLFDSSFKKLTMQEKDALISLSILPESFSTEVAAAVLSDTGSMEARKILRSLRRKSLIDSSSKPGSFTMHRLLQSFAREKGEKEMTETFLNSKSRLNAFYVSLLERLNEQFLTGNSMAAYVEFYENKKNIIESVIESCLDSERTDSVYDVLVKGEIFLASLFCSEAKNFIHIYDTAIKAAKLQKKDKYYRQLLLSRAFVEVTWGLEGKTRHLLSKVNELQAAASLVPNLEKGKYFCYMGIYHFITEETNNGVQLLKEALLSLENCNGAEKRILKMVIFQILAVYFQSLNDLSSASTFYDKAIHQCSAMRDWQLLIIPSMKNEGKESINEVKLQQTSDILLSQPLKCEIIFLLSEAAKTFADANTKQCLSNLLLQIVENIEREVQITLGLLTFHKVVTHLSWVLSGEDPQRLYAARIKYYQEALNEKSPKADNFENTIHLQNKALVSGLLDLGTVFIQTQRFPDALQANQQALEISKKRLGEEHESTADSYRELGVTQANMHNYPLAHQSFQRTLAIRIKLFGEEHERTADSYRDLGVTQHEMKDYNAALQYFQRALTIRIKLFGEEHESTSDIYRELGVTQHQMKDYNGALQSKQRALAIRIRLFGEKHERTADSYRELGVTQHEMKDYNAALRSKQRALAIRIKLFAEEHESTADSYRDLGVTQHEMKDYNAALRSKQRALAIRIKLFGEEHERTADSYRDLGVTQHEMKDYNAALGSKQRALAIRIKLFGKEHESTAEICRELGVTQHQMKDYNAALQSKQRALAVRIKLFGEEHERTADSYRDLGVTQHEMKDYNTALQSKQRALEIRIKLFGEEHESTADIYRELGVTQRQMKDYNAALQSKQRALAIRIKLFGEEHENTADIYRELGVTQRQMKDYNGALQSKQRALAIRIKLFGEEHERTADSYRDLGVTQHEMKDYNAALQSNQRALEIRIKLFGEEHESTADSYRTLGVTQHQMKDYNGALQSKQRALAIRIKLFGEEHESTADSYRTLGVTQHQMKDYKAALQSKQRALEICIKLFGEEHESTAASYRTLGATQHQMHDCTSAFQSFQRACFLKNATVLPPVGKTQHHDINSNDLAEEVNKIKVDTDEEVRTYAE